MNTKNLITLGVVLIAMCFCSVFGSEQLIYSIQDNVIYANTETGAVHTVVFNEGQPSIKTLIESLEVVHGVFTLKVYTSCNSAFTERLYWMNDQSGLIYHISYEEEGFIVSEISQEEVDSEFWHDMIKCEIVFLAGALTFHTLISLM